jgi:hypothetical protein
MDDLPLCLVLLLESEDTEDCIASATIPRQHTASIMHGTSTAVSVAGSVPPPSKFATTGPAPHGCGNTGDGTDGANGICGGSNGGVGQLGGCIGAGKDGGSNGAVGQFGGFVGAGKGLCKGQLSQLMQDSNRHFILHDWE